MRFYVGVDSTSGVEKPSFVFILNSWDDYSTKSKFFLQYVDKNGLDHNIGHIKIIKKGVFSTIQVSEAGLTSILPRTFECLGDEYISLGQSIDFYKNLLESCGQNLAIQVLESLREISWQPPLAVPFEPTHPFRNSLLRANQAHQARRFGQAVINGEELEENFSFSYSSTIPGAAAETETFFDFDEDDDLPHRIVGIIGRNASGKTRYLTNLGQDLVQLRRSSQETIVKRDSRFDGQRPLFNRPCEAVCRDSPPDGVHPDIPTGSTR